MFLLAFVAPHVYQVVSRMLITFRLLPSPSRITISGSHWPLAQMSRPAIAPLRGSGYYHNPHSESDRADGRRRMQSASPMNAIVARNFTGGRRNAVTAHRLNGSVVSVKRAGYRSFASKGQSVYSVKVYCQLVSSENFGFL